MFEKTKNKQRRGRRWLLKNYFKFFSCRRKMISNHFGEKWESTDCDKMCDHCNESPKADSGTELDVTEIAEAAINFIRHAASLDQRLTALKLVDALQGRGGTLLKLVDWTPPKSISSNRSLTETIVTHLLIDNYLKEHFHFTPYNTISYIDPGERKITKPIKLNGIGSSDPVSAKKRPDKKTKKRKADSDEEVFDF